MRERIWTAGILILIAIAVTACGREETPTPVRLAPTATPTVADTPTSLPSPTATLQAMPATVAPTATSTPLPPPATSTPLPPPATPTPAVALAALPLGEPARGAQGDWELTITSTYTSSDISLAGHQIEAYPAHWRMFILIDFTLASLGEARADLLDAGWFTLIDQSGKEGSAVALIDASHSEELVARYAEPVIYPEPLAQLAGTVIFDVAAVAADYTLQVTSVLDQFPPLGLGGDFAPCTAEPAMSVVTLAALLNNEYAIASSGPIRLENGLYSLREQDRSLDAMLSRRLACGHLTDGPEMAAAVLVFNSGTVASEYVLAAVVEEDGKLVTVGTVTLGWSILVRSVTIAQDIIIVDMLVPAETDPDCCPSLPARVRYALRDGELVEETG
jgi:hypothetical protein